jgi:hypothetical protein
MLVDLVGIEPTTSSMPCTENSSGRLVFKQLATGTWGRNGVFGAVSGQFPAKNFNTQNSRAAWAGVQQLQRAQTKDGITQQENQFSA